MKLRGNQNLPVVFVLAIFGLAVPNHLFGQDFQATFKLPERTATPSGTVVLPFSINANAETDGFSFSVDFDEEVLQAIEIEKLHPMPDGTTDYDFEALIINNSNEAPGNGGVDEGFLVGAVIYNLRVIGEFALPPNQDNEVLAFKFQVQPEVPAGSTTEVRFLDGARPHPNSPPAENVAAINGVSVFPGLGASYVYIHSQINIRADLSTFIRGDANGDEFVDISDAVKIISFLYQSGSAPDCLDAADVDDDGELGLADPIYLLTCLFVDGSQQIPSPYPDAGGDPSFDTLDCQPD